MVLLFFAIKLNYFFAAVSLAGPAFIVSTGAGAAVGVVGAAGVAVAALAAESVAGLVPSPPPHEVTNTPNVRATIDNFTNFILLFFSWLCRFIPYSEKGNPPVKNIFRYLLVLFDLVDFDGRIISKKQL